MATTSEVKAGLNDIAAAIRAERQAVQQCKARIAAADANLAALPTVHSGVIDTINGYSAQSTDQFELLSKAELAKLTTEFQALKSKTLTAKNGLNAIDFSI